MPELSRAVHKVLTECLALKKNETLTIIADHAHERLAGKFYHTAEQRCRTPRLLLIHTVNDNKHTLLQSLLPFLRESDALIFLTDASLSHIPARRNLSRAGLRIVSMPGITEECLSRTMNGSFREMQEKSRKIADILTIATNGRLTTPEGTDLVFSLKNRKGYADTGCVHDPGSFSNLPAGEAAAAPAPGSASGKLVLNGSFPGTGILRSPVDISVKDGSAIRISGGEEAAEISKVLSRHGKKSRIIAEIGIGTNPLAQFAGLTLEDEKTSGTMHVAFGNNISFGGNNAVDCHYDAVILKPTLVLDGKTILKDGIFQV